MARTAIRNTRPPLVEGHQSQLAPSDRSPEYCSDHISRTARSSTVIVRKERRRNSPSYFRAKLRQLATIKQGYQKVDSLTLEPSRQRRHRLDQYH